ncbi:MAG: serine hydrolase domain-containing protein [Luteolibacter sp.]
MKPTHMSAFPKLPAAGLAACLSLASSFCVSAEQPTNPAVKKAMQGFIDSREIAGAVTVVADREKMLHFDAAGSADIEANKPMREDSIFWIASMTKPITATAVMMMQEEGKLSVDDPVSKYLQEFKNLKDAAGHEVSITIKQCLTHSSGLQDVPNEEAHGVKTLAEFIPLVVAKPLKFAPDSKWEYCQSGINTVARIVEVVSGKAFPEFLEERIFTPLGMKDTSFYPTEAQIARVANSYKRTSDGKLEKAEITFLGGAISDKDRYPLANGGLFSTAADYTRFAQMILRGGELGGKRFLKPESVKQMTSVQSGDLVTGFTPGNAWGLGWCLIREPQGISGALSSGTFGHGGLFGTQVWIDPVKERIYLLLIQRANFENQGGSDGSDIRRNFQNAAAQ